MGKVAIFFSTLLAFINCSGIGLGTLSPNSDTRPSTQLLQQGTFSGMNGKSVSGAALVFANGIGSYIIRLEGISVPEVGLYMQAYSNIAGLIGSSALKSTSGSQNYYLNNVGVNLIFSNVYIYSYSQAAAYGIAPISSVY